MPTLTELVHFLDKCLESHLYPQDQNGIIVDAGKQILRIGLAIEPWPGLADWVENQQLDALFLHRPWQFDLQTLPANLGIIAYHLSFDEKLTIGYNTLLANQLDIAQIEVLGYKEERPVGMMGKVPEIPFQLFLQKITNTFHGLEQVHQGKTINITKIAIAGAMTESMVRQAVERNVEVYITGQFRKPAYKVVVETGIHVLAIGHRRSEDYGLRLLAEILREQWPVLQVIVKSE